MLEKLKARVTKVKKKKERESSTRKGQRNGQGADPQICFILRTTESHVKVLLNGIKERSNVDFIFKRLLWLLCEKLTGEDKNTNKSKDQPVVQVSDNKNTSE